MGIPFTVEQFLAVFEQYNRAIGVAPLAAYLLGLAALALALRGGTRAGRVALAILAFFWAFNGAVYHIAFFRRVNPIAAAFGALFLLQSALFALAAWRAPPALRFRAAPRQVLGLAFAAYAMVLYPVLGAAAGHVYPRAPVFGVAPCPTTIFTFAILLLAEGAVPAWLLVIPFLWSLLGFSAAVQLGITQDLGLVVAGVAGTALLLRERYRHGSGRSAAPARPG